MNIKKFAQTYLDHGWQIVPLVKKSKRVSKAGWIGLEFTAEDFQDGDNIGLRSVDGLVFVDLDSPEAVKMADEFLPTTPSVYGRPSKPRSKRIYKSVIPKTIAYRDSDRTTLVEIRSNHQDMAPPSEHPSGEVLAWESDLGKPGEVDAPVLIRCVKLLASAVLIARHYAPSGARHDWTLALAGTLKQRGVTEEESVLMIREAAQWSRDDKWTDRLREVSSTFAHSDDEPITGGKTLKEIATGGLAESLIKLWGRTPATSDNAYALNSKGFPDARSIMNITRALTRLGADLTYDSFARKPFINYTSAFRGTSYAGLLDDDIATDLWIDVDLSEQFRPTQQFFFEVVQAVARQSSFHPILDYFKTLTWDGEPRIDTWLTVSAQAANTPYIRAVSALVLLAAVRRIRQPGCKFDEMVVLEQADQGKNKSTGIQLLCHDPKWFSDDLPLNADSKSIIERTAGKWIVESSDLAGMRASDHETLKSMLSRQVDGPVRLAYARIPVERPRQFIIIGTTNSNQYLSDITGNRRFWPVSIKGFDVSWLRTNRDQLWAEACVREEQGEPIRLDPSLWRAASSQQSQRVFSHPWVEAIAEEYSAREPGVRLTPEDIWNFLAVPIDRRTLAGNKFVASAMQAVGYRRITMSICLQCDLQAERCQCKTTPKPARKAVLGWGRD